MRLRSDKPLDDQAERELSAVDRALAGREVDPDLADWAELTALLAEERPEPAPGWTEEIDRRVAAGFRADGGGGWANLVARFEGVRPMKVLAPVGALAAVMVVAVVGVASLDPGGDDSGDSANSANSTTLEGATSSPDGGSAAQGIEDSSAAGVAGFPAPSAAQESAVEPIPSGANPDFETRSSRDQIAPGIDKRQVDRDVTLALSTRPEDVRETTDQAIAITRSAGGVVSSSQVSEAGKQATATLELVIPTRELDSTLDQLTDLANVQSLTEASEDITKPFVSAQDRLKDAEAQRAELLRALGNADTAAEAQAIQFQLDDIRREISVAESQFENIARQARLAEVSLTIQGDPNAEAKDDDRTIGDWLDDTASVLRDVAGILLVSAAILVPLGILVAVAWFVVSGLRRRRRERALDA